MFIPATSPSRGNKIWWRISSYSKDTRRAKPNMKHCHPGFFFQAMSSHIRGSFCLFLWIFTTLLLTAAAAANAAPSGCPCCRCSCSWQAANPLFLMRKYIFMNTKNSGMSKKFRCFNSKPKKWWTWSTFFKYQSWILKRSLNIALTKIKEESVSHFWF